MPIIEINGDKIVCEMGANLRTELLKHNVSVYNGNAAIFNCNGLGTCGTCTFSVTGKVNEITDVEKWRLNFNPHKLSDQLRLSCQCRVMGDISIQKHNGFWGNIKQL